MITPSCAAGAARAGRVTVGIIAVAAACGGDGAAARGTRDVTVRDSAGITIVENGAAPSRPLLVLDSVPAVDIGDGQNEDPDYQLFGVRYAFRRGDGSILVANAGTSELRLYDANGAFMRRIGRRGAGPGEFGALGWVGLTRGDTVLTFDYDGRRLSRFTPDGPFASSLVLGGVGNPDQLSPYGSLDDGRVLVGQLDQFSRPYSNGDHRDTVTLQLMRSDGVRRDTLGRFPGGDYTVRAASGGGISLATVPYGRATHFAASAGSIAVGIADSYEVLLLDETGTIRRVVRRRADPVPVTDEDMAATLEKRQGNPVAAALRERFLLQVARMPKPEAMPTYRALRVDRLGRLWVREAAHVGESGRWAVYAPDGGLLADLRLPERFTVTDAGAEYLLGVLRDENDLERVQLFRLRSPGGDA